MDCCSALMVRLGQPDQQTRVLWKKRMRHVFFRFSSAADPEPHRCMADATIE